KSLGAGVSLPESTDVEPAAPSGPESATIAFPPALLAPPALFAPPAFELPPELETPPVGPAPPAPRSLPPVPPAPAAPLMSAFRSSKWLITEHATRQPEAAPSNARRAPERGRAK